MSCCNLNIMHTQNKTQLLIFQWQIFDIFTVIKVIPAQKKKSVEVSKGFKSDECKLKLKEWFLAFDQPARKVKTTFLCSVNEL